MRKRPLLLIASVFLTGLVCQKYFCLPIAIWVVLLIGQEVWIGMQNKKFRKMAGRSVLLLSAFLLGIFYMHKETSFRNAYMSKLTDGSRITVWGELIKLESVEYGNRGILSDCYIDFGEGVVPCNDIMVYTSNDQYRLGQIYKITGKVNMFSNARNEGNFDALLYYQSLKIGFAVDEEVYEVLREEKTAWKECLWSLKERVMEVYASCMNAKAAGFYQTMVLGDKTDLETTLKDLFLIGGISHILAISGLHVSILGRGMYRILRRSGLGFGISGLCGGIVLLFYCFMVGSSASTVRAVGMMLLFFLAQWMGRSYDMLNALGGMVLFLLWENPFLIENSGFWFSVTALIGVGVVGQELSKRPMEESEDKRKQKPIVTFDGLWMSLGITLTTLPVTALSYYEVPMYSVFVNFVVLPLLTPVFGLAVVGGLLGVFGISQGVLEILFAPCQWLLTFYEWVCDAVSKLPYATVICGKPESWQVVVYYMLLFGGVYVMGRMREHTKRTIVFVTTFLSCILCIFFPKAKPSEISFLDVGQGDGIYISAGDGTTYFIDGGSSSVDGVGEYRILPFLKAKGVASIDYWFVSHCDTDHISGLYEIIENEYKIEHIVLSERCSTNEKQNELISIATEYGIKVIHMKAGHRICSANMEIICLAPIVENGGEIGVDANEDSLVIQVEWKSKNKEDSFTALFAGDISTEIENALCESGVVEKVDMVKANHHGSNYSNGEYWFKTVSPKYIVVSCGMDNLYGHPGTHAVERMEESGAEIFYTMENGQVKFEMEINR